MFNIILNFQELKIEFDTQKKILNDQAMLDFLNWLM